jgi:hypothetical protein
MHVNMGEKFSMAFMMICTLLPGFLLFTKLLTWYTCFRLRFRVKYWLDRWRLDMSLRRADLPEELRREIVKIYSARYSEWLKMSSLSTLISIAIKGSKTK